MNIQPGAIREVHCPPNTDEWLSSNPGQLPAGHFGLTLDQASSLTKHQEGFFD
ncbi:hypothetical protein [Dyadobacter frigoris]|uniref:hypothetical protein n=1 Tax=Dyadobacter frigoris TaxID=2576211 RepID=UPI001485B2B8|nr:hypothetical protein [Dyadobacter frigoris]GLU56590.1 hypothetical protein Dfri01_60510 [Dyadobacter frigoris]